MNSSNIIKAHILLSILAIIGGLHFVIAKNVVPEFIQPSGMIFIRVVLGTSFFFFIDAIRKDDSKIEKQDWLKLIICGVSGVAANQLLFFNGLALTSPVNASLMMLLSPLITLLAAVIVLKEKIKWFNVLGVFLGIAGASVLILNKSITTTKTSNSLGDILVLMNATAWSIYMITVAPLMQKYHPFKVLKYTFLFGMIVVIPFGFSQFVVIQWATFTAKAWIGFVFILLLATIFAYYVNTAVLRHVSPAVSGVYIYIQPIITTIYAVFLQVEDLSLIKLLSAMMIFAGVYLSSKKTKRV